MRIVRTFRLALAVAAVVPALAGAQAASNARRGFDDSWFWGIRGGSTMFTTGASGDSKVSAPTVGAEWMITRTRIAAYLAVEQAFFDNTAAVFDPSAAGSARAVDISDLRSYNAGVYFFPVRYGNLRPYAGLGIAINVIQHAEPRGTFTSEESQLAVFETVDAQSSRVSAVLSAGAQYQVGRAALFGQIATLPTRRNFLINGAANTFVLQGGVRFNLLGAIEKVQ
jgi:outer membrane protein W